jgi:hypothetical protein
LLIRSFDPLKTTRRCAPLQIVAKVQIMHVCLANGYSQVHIFGVIPLTGKSNPEAGQQTRWKVRAGTLSRLRLVLANLSEARRTSTEE